MVRCWCDLVEGFVGGSVVPPPVVTMRMAGCCPCILWRNSSSAEDRVDSFTAGEL